MGERRRETSLYQGSGRQAGDRGPEKTLPSLKGAGEILTLKFCLLSFVFCLLSFASQAYAQMKLEIIPLKSRTVEEMIPIVRSILGGQGTVTGMSGQLIVRTTPRNLTEVKKVLAALDTPPRNLLITVKQGLRKNLEREEASVSADVRIGKGRVIVSPREKGSGGLEVSGSSGNSKVSARIGRQSSSSDEMNIQQVRVLEGRPAVIHITQSIPFQEKSTVRSRGNIFRNESVTFKDVTTGLTVLPRVQGDRVTLEVNPVRSSFENGRFEIQRLNTTVSGRLGEWIELGGIVQEKNAASAGIGESARAESAEKRGVFIKVEEQR